MLLVLCVLKVMLYFVSDYVKNVTMIVSLHKNFVENRFLFFFHSEMKKKTLSHLHFFNTLINKTFCKFSFGMIFLHFKCPEFYGLSSRVTPLRIFVRGSNLHMFSKLFSLSSICSLSSLNLHMFQNYFLIFFCKL